MSRSFFLPNDDLKENGIFLCKGFEGDGCFYYRAAACTSLDLCIKKVLDGVPHDRRSPGRFNVCKCFTNERLAFSVTFNADRQPIHRTGVPNRKAEEIAPPNADGRNAITRVRRRGRHSVTPLRCISRWTYSSSGIRSTRVRFLSSRGILRYGCD